MKLAVRRTYYGDRLCFPGVVPNGLVDVRAACARMLVVRGGMDRGDAVARAERSIAADLPGLLRDDAGLEPFLAGRLEGLCGDYPVWTCRPVRAQDVPGAILRAHHEAARHKGPAIVVVPMDDWSADTDGDLGLAAPVAVVRTGTDPAEAVAHLLPPLRGSAAPALVVGAGADTRGCWDALTSLAEPLAARRR
jgi:hypothetical protein